jgi:NTE family protein
MTTSDLIPRSETDPSKQVRVVLVFQGGGALGAYQAGVYQAVHEAGIEPRWIIGTSIGAFNAALIAGNHPEHRVGALEEFWRRVTTKPLFGPLASWPPLADQLSYWATLWTGIPGFFSPNTAAFCSPHMPLGVNAAGYYSTAPLRQTLSELIDISLINTGVPRLTVGAARVRTSQMHYFDNRKTRIGLEHIMASGALPPAFPAVRIDGEFYWDGGILSNTPTEVVFDDNPRRDSLIFAVHVWQPVGPVPETIAQVLHRQKDIQYSSRMASQISRLQEMHRLRHIISELSARLPATDRGLPELDEMVAEGCLTRMHVVQLTAPRLEREDETKGVDFSPAGIQARWAAGYADTRQILDSAPWRLGDYNSLDGVIVHELPDNPAMDEIGRPVMEGKS